MPHRKKKPFIEKKKAVSFHLVHRSQRDPLAADETAPQRVLLPTHKKNDEERRAEQRKYGVFFDDDYDYLQHLKEPSGPSELIPTSTVSVPNRRNENEETSIISTTGIKLPSSVFASEFEEDVGLLNKAAPVSGPRLDFDPDIVAALDDDFDFDDPANLLEDDFILQANKPTEEEEGMDVRKSEAEDGSEWADVDDEKEEGSDDNDYDSAGSFSDEDVSTPGKTPGALENHLFWEEETKSRFTEYSMTSSVMRRNEQLTLHDERFEKVTPGSKAAIANLCIGDIITAIDGENTSNMTHLEAQNKIKGCVDNMTLTVSRSEHKVWSPLVTEEGKRHPYKMNLASEPQEVLHIGSAHNRSAMPFTASPASGSAPRVITNQYNNPSGLYSSENISNFNSALEAKTAAGGPETNGRGLEHSQSPSGLVIDKESEVYKMLQEKQELNEPPKQSTSFLVLQEILESEEKGDPNKPSGFRSVKAPVTKVAASIGNAQKLPMCDKCGTGIVGVFVKLRDHHRHPECYVCTDCGTNLKQKGHFFVEDQIYCEKHARERVTPPEGYDVVTVFPK